MSITLDGQMLFDEQRLEIELCSISRDSIERTIAGLDGVLSVDLGGRSRKIKQKGKLRARSRKQMNERMAAISAYMDGDTHKLVISSGETIDNLRMNTFKITKKDISGSSIVIDYEIIYTQLVV